MESRLAHKEKVAKAEEDAKDRADARAEHAHDEDENKEA
jgi:hypothetical protein